MGASERMVDESGRLTESGILAMDGRYVMLTRPVEPGRCCGSLVNERGDYIGGIYREGDGFAIMIGEYGVVRARIPGRFAKSDFVSRGSFNFGYATERRFALKPGAQAVA